MTVSTSRALLTGPFAVEADLPGSPRSSPAAAPPSDERAAQQVMWGMLVLAVLIRGFFWAYTDRTWEDALITVRHAENAAQGVGLTHHPDHGEPVHGFTSPISVLIPLAAECVVAGSGIPAQKGVSLLAAAATIYCAYRVLRHPEIRLSPAFLGFALGYLAIEHHQILFGMAGMETQCIVALVWWSLWMFVDRRTGWLGVACGAALWGRPDGLFLDVALWLGLVLERRWKAVVAVPLIAAAVFLPWIVFTELYYGSFVPHTVTAKKNTRTSFFFEASSLAEFLSAWGRALARRFDNLRLWLAPSFGGSGGGTVNFLRGARPLQGMMLLGSAWGGLTLWRSPARVLPLFVVVYGGYLLTCMEGAFGWYLPPWLGVVAALFALGCQRIAERCSGAVLRTVPAAIVVGMLGLYGLVLTRTFPAERMIQRELEEGVRTPMGRWLGANVSERHWIACECLGYLGYHARRPMLDFPGLSSPRSVRAHEAHPRSLSALIDRERPEWLALRGAEVADLGREFPECRALYVERQRFRAAEDFSRRLAECLWLEPESFLSGDTEFVALERRGE